MRDDVSDIATFYNGNPEGEHVRLESHQLEYDLSWRYLTRYLPSRGSILEVGAASGRYTLELARRGYKVTAVDISEKLLEINRQTIASTRLSDQVRFILADARQLGEDVGNGFHAALLMGPLYHLVFESDRKLALQEACDRLRKGGILFSTFISRLGIMGDLLKNVPGWIEDRSEVRSILKKGKDPHHYPKGGFRGYFALAAELAPLHEAVGFETLVVAGIEPSISADDESYNKLQGKQRKLWLDLLYGLSAESSMLAASRHLLYVGRKM